MATEAMKEIIDWAFHNDEWNEALLDIKGFQLQLVGRFSRSELDLLEEQGFNFSASGVVQRRNDLKSFIRQHPEVMSSDFETLIDKIIYWLEKDTEMKQSLRAKESSRIRSKYQKPKKPLEDEQEKQDSE